VIEESRMLAQLRPAFLTLLVLTLLTGGIYPLVVTAIARVGFAHAAGGSLIERDGVVVGSELIGQPFDDPKYFWGRPSATTPPCNGGASSGSNLGPTNPALIDAVRTRIEALRASDPERKEPVPVDLVTTSASGLDPHVSPAAALWQVARVAKARGIAAAKVRTLVLDCVEGRDLGLFGEPRVNVLELNLALDALR
jgi:K+-transporting ATPase ATPase C chain